MSEMIELLKPMIVIFGCALFLVIGLKEFLKWRNSPKQKGVRGERCVAQLLRTGLPDEYRIMNDVYLPLPDGTTTQIDHIVVSRYGIFVIETKTYSGWVFCDEKGPEWIQVIYHRKSRFQNPIRQNYRHICALEDNLGIDKSYFHNVVVFSEDCTFKTQMPKGVVYSRHAVDFIRSFEHQLIKVKQLDEIVSVIAAWQGTLSRQQISDHVANLEKRHSPAHEGEVPKCPYCGCEMVLRVDGDLLFYSCKSYPKCCGRIKV